MRAGFVWCCHWEQGRRHAGAGRLFPGESSSAGDMLELAASSQASPPQLETRWSWLPLPR